jgi:hypothetical protein
MKATCRMILSALMSWMTISLAETIIDRARSFVPVSPNMNAVE